MNPLTLLISPTTYATQRDFVLAASMARLAEEGDPRVIRPANPLLRLLRRLLAGLRALRRTGRSTVTAHTGPLQAGHVLR